MSNKEVVETIVSRVTGENISEAKTEEDVFRVLAHTLTDMKEALQKLGVGLDELKD